MEEARAKYWHEGEVREYCSSFIDYFDPRQYTNLTGFNSYSINFAISALQGAKVFTGYELIYSFDQAKEIVEFTPNSDGPGATSSSGYYDDTGKYEVGQNCIRTVVGVSRPKYRIIGNNRNYLGTVFWPYHLEVPSNELYVYLETEAHADSIGHNQITKVEEDLEYVKLKVGKLIAADCLYRLENKKLPGDYQRKAQEQISELQIRGLMDRKYRVQLPGEPRREPPRGPWWKLW